MIPIWAVAIIAVIIVLLLIASIYFLKRRKTRLLSTNTLNKLAGDDDDIEKKTISSDTNQTVIASEKHHKQQQLKPIPQQSTITNASTVIAPVTPTSPVPKLSKSNLLKADASTEGDAESSSDEIILTFSKDNEQYDHNVEDDEDDDHDFINSVSPREIIISLPLPPPSTSFFSDKMELENYSYDENGEGTAKEDLYALYSKLTNKDANSNTYKRNSFLQQKAATIKSTLIKQSLRLQPHRSTATATNHRVSLHNLFTTTTNTTASDTAKPGSAVDSSSNFSTTTATVVGRLSEDDTKYKLPVVATQQSTNDSTKVIIDMDSSIKQQTTSSLRRQSSLARTASAIQRQSSYRRSVDSTNNVTSLAAPTPALNTAGVFTTPKSSLETSQHLQEDSQHPAAAAAFNARHSAMHVIRSASIKARTRSMIIDKSKLSALGVSDDSPNRSNVLRQNSMTHFTGNAPAIKKGEFMTITSGSVRRFVRDSVVIQDGEPIVALSATREKLNSDSRKFTNVTDIAGYWNNDSHNNRSTISRQASMQKQQQQPQHESVRHSVDDAPATVNNNSSNDQQNQYYKASLSTSIFGTLSKGTMNPVAAAHIFSNESTDNENTNSTPSGGLLSRHGSLKRGATISRNTLKFIKNSATQGVNRSLKGLFDSNTTVDDSSAATSSFSPIIDDSLKMELSPSESMAAMRDMQTVVDEKVIYAEEQRRKQYIHDRAHTQETDLSSNKLALGEGGISDLPDESSKKTAIDDNEDQIDNMYASKDSSYYFGVTEEEVESLGVVDSTAKATLPQQQSSQDKTQLKQQALNATQIDTTDHLNNDVEVEDIRRMLQETWLKNMRESGSSYSMLSDAASAVTGNSNIAPASPTSPTISNFSSSLQQQQQQQQQQQYASKSTNRFSQQPPPQQQQSQLTKSLLTQQVAKRASLLAAGQQQEIEEQQQQLQQGGPEPSASFSSSTVRTVVPENEQEQQNGSNKVVVGRLSPYNSYTISSTSSAQQRYNHMANIFSQQYDETMPSSLSSSPRNSVSAASTFSRATRSSSGNNSAATAIRLLPSSSVTNSNNNNNNNKTWNGRMVGGARKSGMTHHGSYHQSNSYSSSRPSILQQRFDYDDDEDNDNADDKDMKMRTHEEQNEEDGLLNASAHERQYFTTMRRGQKTRGGIPWMAMTDSHEDTVEHSSTVVGSSSQTFSQKKTLAQIERDRYLEGSKHYI